VYLQVKRIEKLYVDGILEASDTRNKPFEHNADATVSEDGAIVLQNHILMVILMMFNYGILH